VLDKKGHFYCRHKFLRLSISKKLNETNFKISLSNKKPFPNLNFLSNYHFNKKIVKILPNGDMQGGYTKMITSLIAFSSIRSLVADCYSEYIPACYDLPSLFLLDLFRYINGYQNTSKFLELLRDNYRGWVYRTHAGILNNIHFEATFSVFRARLGENLYHLPR
jgi:hypothetical protein